MSIIGVIPARGGSKGLPGKNIRPIDGKPMIAYIIEDALSSELLDRVIVSTDGEDIAEVGRKFGAEVIMRPPEISGDTAAIEDALRHVVRVLEARGENIDAVALMQANLPLREPGLIDRTIRKFMDSDLDSVVTAFKINQRPEWLKRFRDGLLTPYMECRIYRRQELEDLYMVDGVVEVIRRGALMDCEGKTGLHVYMGQRVGLVEHDRLYSQDVDSLIDLKIAEAIIKVLKENPEQ